MGCCNSARNRWSENGRFVESFDHCGDAAKFPVDSESAPCSTEESADTCSTTTYISPPSFFAARAVLTDEELLRQMLSFADVATTRCLAATCRQLNEAVLLLEALDVDSVDAARSLEEDREVRVERCAQWLDIPQGLQDPQHSMASLMEVHRDQPLTSFLCLARMTTPNCVPIAACFSALIHVSIGSPRVSQGGSIVSDRDVDYLTRSHGHQLHSLQLIKLQGLTCRTLASISAHCTALRTVVVFGCGRVRTSANRSPPATAPHLFPFPPAQTSCTASAALFVLDLRYSLDLTDELLGQITRRYTGIRLFLGSNLKGSDIVQGSSTQTSHTEPSLLSLAAFSLTSISPDTATVPMAISQAGWVAFVKNFENSSRGGAEREIYGGGPEDMLFYVDDLQREHNYCACQRARRRGSGGIPPARPMHWLLHCPRYQPTGIRDTPTAPSASETVSASEIVKDVLPPYVTNFSLEELVLSLPVPLEANASSLLSSGIHNHN